MQSIISYAYLKQLRRSCINQINKPNINVATFLYEYILNDEHALLVQSMNQSQIQELNIQISRTILYGHQFTIIQDAFNILAQFIYFFIGSQLQINQIIQQSNNIWDQIITQCLQAIFEGINIEPIWIERFKIDLEFLQKVLESLKDFRQIIQLLIFVVEQDIQLANPIKRQHIKHSFDYIEASGRIDKINLEHQHYKKFKVLRAFLNHDCHFIDEFKIETLLQLTYQFINLDHKQFQIILGRLSDQQLQQFLNKQTQTQIELQTNYYKLVLVGRCLKSLQKYDFLMKLYEKLQQDNKTKSRYLIYIHCVLVKCYLSFNRVDVALDCADKAIILIQQFQQDNLIWYRQKQNSKDFCWLLVVRLLLRYISNNFKNKDNQSLYIQDKQSIKQQMKVTDDLGQERSIKLIYQETFKLLKKKQILQNKFQLNRYYDLIRKNLVLDLTKQYINQLLTFVCITFCIQKSTQNIEYLDKSQRQILFSLLQRVPDLLSKEIQAQVFFQLGCFENAYQIAKQENLKKIIADYLFYKQDVQALTYYEQVKDADSYFQAANILMNQQEYKVAYKYYKKAQKMSKVYLTVFNHKIKILKNYIPIKERSQILKSVCQSIGSYLEPSSLFRSSLQQSNLIQRQCKLVEQKRNDIEFLQKEIMTYFAPEYDKLIEAIEQFMIYSDKFPCSSSYLQENLRIIGVLGRGGQCRVNKIILDEQILASKISHVTFNPVKNIINENQCIQIYQRLNELNILSYARELNIPYVMKNLHIGIRFRQLSYDGLRQISIYNISPLYKPFTLIVLQSNQVKIDFAEKVAICLKQLQVNKISHQDVKPENVLVDEDLNPVLIDFGISIMNFTSNNLGEVNFLTHNYADPQLMQKNQQSRKNDVYSYGILLYDLFTGRRPYDDIDFYEDNFLNYKTHQEYIAKIEIPQIQYLIEKCANHLINNRYSLSQILFHFLLMKECRQDVLYLIQTFFIEFQNIDFSYEDYLLIKEFIAVSLKYEEIDDLQLIKLIQVSDEIIIFKSQQQLICHQIKIDFKDNKYINILKIIKVIVNFFHLSKCTERVDKVLQLHNFRIKIQQEILQFELFFVNNQIFQNQLDALESQFEKMDSENCLLLLLLINEFILGNLIKQNVYQFLKNYNTNELFDYIIELTVKHQQEIQQRDHLQLHLNNQTRSILKPRKTTQRSQIRVNSIINDCWQQIYSIEQIIQYMKYVEGVIQVQL